jgi:hypothetical protein
MFEFSCQNSNLVNWILDHVSQRPDAIFPRHKGWEAYVRLFYPSSYELSLFIVTVTNRRECLLFIPFDESSPTAVIHQILQARFVNSIKSELKFDCTNIQLIFLTSEKYREPINKVLENIQGPTHLLVLDSDKAVFIRGNFENPRLEYRLEHLKFDPEMISTQFVPDIGGDYKGLNRSIFYQHLFHVLNKFWLQGNRQPKLREVIREAVPVWPLLGKNERKALVSRVENDLQIAFESLMTDIPKVSTLQKKQSSQPETIIQLPDPPESRKEINEWMKVQHSILRYLSDDTEQITIDLLNLTYSQ